MDVEYVSVFIPLRTLRDESTCTMIQFVKPLIAFLPFWCYQGMVPKLIWQHPDELKIWQVLGVSEVWALRAVYAAGVAEVIFGLLFLFYASKVLHYFNLLGLLFLLLLVMLLLPSTLVQAFNPVIMNMAMMGLSWVYVRYVASLSRS